MADPAGAAREDADLIQWLYVISGRHAWRRRVRASDRADVVQAAVSDAYMDVVRTRGNLQNAVNPAASVETIVRRAVAGAHHEASMAGFGGAPPNGQHWHDEFPRQVGGVAADRMIQALPLLSHRSSGCIPATGARIRDWIAVELRIELSGDAVHAVEYVLDRLVAGVSRRSLLRGGHSALTRDPALGYLGFTPTTARLFASWLLGTGSADAPPAVVDVAIGAIALDPESVGVLRSRALAGGFASETRPNTARVLTSVRIFAHPGVVRSEQITTHDGTDD